jgi:hypothetical protein
MTDIKLKPCPTPWCKSTNINYFWNESGGSINCMECGTSLNGLKDYKGPQTFNEAMKIWNNRTIRESL